MTQIERTNRANVCALGVVKIFAVGFWIAAPRSRNQAKFSLPGKSISMEEPHRVKIVIV